MSDSRILGCDDRTVTISVKDRESDEPYPVEIEGVEFVRRYLQHALPGGFHRLRYYGFLHCRSKEKLQSIRQQLGEGETEAPGKAESKPEPRPMLCPKCRKPMILTGHRSRAPPWRRSIDRIWRTRYAA